MTRVGKRQMNKWRQDLVKAAKPKAKPKKEKPAEQGFIPFREETFKPALPKTPKKRSAEEYHLQVRCRKWLDLMYPELMEEIRRFHVPNQGYGATDEGEPGETEEEKEARKEKKNAEARRRGYFLKQMGVLRGVTDFFIIKRVGSCPGIIFDFKRPGESLSDEQLKFFDSMRADGWICVAVETFEEFTAAVIGYLGPSQRMKSYWSK